MVWMLLTCLVTAALIAMGIDGFVRLNRQEALRLRKKGDSSSPN